MDHPFFLSRLTCTSGDGANPSPNECDKDEYTRLARTIQNNTSDSESDRNRERQRQKGRIREKENYIERKTNKERKRLEVVLV